MDDVSGAPASGTGSREPSPAVSALPGFDPSRCANCEGAGWVCENHPDKPWEGLSAKVGACGCGAGAPCPVCNLRMAAAGLTEPLRQLVQRAVSLLESAERETNWGDPLFGPSPSESVQEALDALRDRDRSGEADETLQAAQPKARARAEGIVRKE